MARAVPTLRDYQVDVLKRLRAELDRTDAGAPKTLVCVGPTGCGKGTVIAAMLAACARRGEKTMVVAHVFEILEELKARTEAYGVRCGYLVANQKGDVDAPVQVASVATLHARPQVWPTQIKLLVIDEGHHVMAPQYLALLRHYVDLGVKVVLFTATPLRLDGKGLDAVCDGMLEIATPSALLRDGRIALPEVWGVDRDALPDLSEVKTSKKGDYDEAELGKAVNTAKLVGDVWDHWEQRAKGLQTIVFAVHRAHAQRLTEEAVRRGHAALYLDGKTKDGERNAALDRFRRGEVTILVQCALFAEGVDIPAVKCVVMARPTKSLTVWLQACGRCMRPFGAVAPVILDHGDNFDLHGHPCVDRKWKLAGKGVGKATGVAVSIRCKECHHATLRTPGLTACPKCGAAYVVAGGWREVEDVAGALVKKEMGDAVEASSVTATKMAWDRLCQKAIAHGYEEGWARKQFKDVYRRWPDAKTYPFPERTYARTTDPKKREEVRRLEIAARRTGQDRAWIERRFRNLYGEAIADLEAREHVRIRAYLEARAAKNPAAAQMLATMGEPAVDKKPTTVASGRDEAAEELEL